MVVAHSVLPMLLSQSTGSRESVMKDNAGTKEGLSMRKDFDSEVSSDFQITEGMDPISGNPRQCVGKKKSYSVSSKGKSFDVGS